MKKTILLVAALAFFATACNKPQATSYDKKKAAQEEQKEEPEKQEDEPSDPSSLPVMGTHTTYSTSLEEISGICLSKDKDYMWAVGDQGNVAKISFDGKTTAVWYHDADMEDVTVDLATGDLLVAIEGAQKLYRIYSPNFNKYDSIFYVKEAVDGEYGNSGLEGLSYYKDGMVFIGSQWGAYLWLYTTDGKKITKISLESKFGKSKIDEVGGLCYDSVRDWLWVVDSELFKLTVLDMKDINVDGTINLGNMKLVAQYDVKWASNPESVCVDHAHSCVWVGDDSSSPKVYKINFTNL